MCKEDTAGWLVGHLSKHGIVLQTNRTGCANSNVCIEWAVCLCGRKFSLDEFYEHVSCDDCPCEVLYLLSRGD